jgi:hypothetical protein
MATPTTYNLTYDSPCDSESGCGGDECGGKPEFNARPQIFCTEVTINGRTVIVPAAITVGGQTFTPKTVVANNGTFVCLAV